MNKQNAEITQLLNQWIAGDLSVENELINIIYPLLRNVAHIQLKSSSNSDLNTTLIVNELYFKLKQQNRVQLANKNHFLALSARLIRQIIIDQIRCDQSIKRGRLYQQVTLQEQELEGSIKNPAMSTDWLTLDLLLKELNEIDPESVKLIELRFFAGLNLEETAKVCNTSESTISRNWQFAKSWLASKLGDN